MSVPTFYFETATCTGLYVEDYLASFTTPTTVFAETWGMSDVDYFLLDHKCAGRDTFFDTVTFSKDMSNGKRMKCSRKVQAYVRWLIR